MNDRPESGGNGPVLTVHGKPGGCGAPQPGQVETPMRRKLSGCATPRTGSLVLRRLDGSRAASGSAAAVLKLFVLPVDLPVHVVAPDEVSTSVGQLHVDLLPGVAL